MPLKEEKKEYLATSFVLKALEKNLKEDKNLLARLQYL